MKRGCLITLGVLFAGFLLLIAVIGIAAQFAPPEPKPKAVAARHVDTCGTLQGTQHQVVAALSAGSYQSAYDLASKGLAVVGSCNSDEAYVIKAYLLSGKARAEHYLPHGDSRTDLNLANQLLQECVTDFYGSDTSASCDTELQNNIHQQTVWDMQ